MQTKMLAYIPNFTKNHIYMYGIHIYRYAVHLEWCIITVHQILSSATDKCNIHCKTKL